MTLVLAAPDDAYPQTSILDLDQLCFLLIKMKH